MGLMIKIVKISQDHNHVCRVEILYPEWRTVPGAALGVLLCPVDVLTQDILDLVLVSRLKVVAHQARGRLQSLQPLLDYQLVDHREILQT